MSNPCLAIPLADYESHMTAPSVQQLRLLSDLFAEAISSCRPRSIAVLGVAGGNGLDRIDTQITKRIVGIDVNHDYLEIVRARYGELPGLELHQADLAVTNPNIQPVDLVYAALIFEHAGIDRCIDNAVEMVAKNGTLAVVLQLPSAIERAVPATAPDSIQRLSSHFQLVDAVALVKRLESSNFQLERQTTRPAASGKALWMGLFRHGPTASFVVRPSNADDVNEIAAIYGHYVLGSSATFEVEVPSSDEICKRRAAILDLGLPYLVAEQGGKVIGYAYASPYRPRPAYRFTVEDSIYIHPQNIREGCGSALLAALIEHCEKGPWRQVIAVIGGADNTGSVHLHEKFGFTKVGVLRSVGYKFDTWIDTVLMQRELGKPDS